MRGSFKQKLLVVYAVCLVEGCGLKFKSFKSWQQHLVEKHKFPTSFEFFKKARPSKKQRQKQHCKQAFHGKDEPPSMMEVEDETINGFVSAVSKLKHISFNSKK
ncbi:hypothetical protein SLEP1_g6987 [Rubroshorea leprosula]|uniref:C2H2-type domain-containing protein n=1 Tax=Rubroshorea leprosula TaxID=152421 RepID=A0AAV5I667_9ROSI|nr:hypothetical protein SLEP1_g6987 [Rubroshorea leprosula]